MKRYLIFLFLFLILFLLSHIVFGKKGLYIETRREYYENNRQLQTWEERYYSEKDNLQGFPFVFLYDRKVIDIYDEFYLKGFLLDLMFYFTIIYLIYLIYLVYFLVKKFVRKDKI